MSVIAVLFGLLLVWGEGARERAREASCQSNLRQIGVALHLYADDHDARLPSSSDALVYMADVYMKNWHILQCPSDHDPRISRREDIDHGVSYFLVPGFASDDPPSEIVAGDTAARHRGGWNALRLDGTCELRPPGELAPYLAKGAKNDED